MQTKTEMIKSSAIVSHYDRSRVKTQNSFLWLVTLPAFFGIFSSFAARLGEESWNPRRIKPRHKMRSSVAISGCLQELKRFIGNYCMKIKGKQTEKSRETSIKTADTLRLSASLHNSVFCRGAAWAHCTCGFWSNYCATFSRNFRQFTFFLPLLSTVDKKAARRILRQANLLARVIELNNEISVHDDRAQLSLARRFTE